MKKILIISLLLVSGMIGAQEISVMSYNIKYANENDGINSWSNRKEFITNQMKFYEPDIFGVQEAVHEQMIHFKENLSGYDFVGVGREDGKQKGEYSAIFYKTGDFKVLEADTFWLSQTPDKVSTGWDAALPRISTYALMQEQTSGRKFWFFNTHFDHVGVEARKNSVKLILQKIAEINTEGLPVFLTGDFNLEPDSEPIQLVMKELKDSREVAEITFGNEGTFNGYHWDETPARRIDFIFVSEGISVKKYAVLTDSKEKRYASDHFPVMVILKI